MQETQGGPVAENVRRQIMAMMASGQLAPGDRLGSEREMAALFSVSRSTLRSALLPLAHAGIIERRTGRGGGTFIRHDIVTRDAAPIAAVDVTVQGAQPVRTTRVLGTERRPATDLEATTLGIALGEPVITVHRLRLADDLPLSLEWACMHAAKVPDLLEQPLGGSLCELVQVRYGLYAESASESIEVVPADADQAAWLGVPVGAPLLSITAQMTDAAGTALVYGRDLYRADRIRLRANPGLDIDREIIGTDGRVERRVSA